ncbi:bifunctional adenosylcobinamide kinase/adenosylcobinamide-phosphate guanylyltransferase [Oryzibacter oryziterrae]|uniref:bifunctional adenosylcobinamide kinase/adenosylcobinamide-phosphate guanylyltransferase n=1 Tax=Oryzibacter oryziterrae TaxID=2766474 RepID=UPI001F00DFB5|nr:bifunctional adenosylcobinamide kinase/adenosylcobinamide-phosphate guanylyltransferase [Oryzibacter oryziterrae]
MSGTTLVLGGARSGKSRLAERLVRERSAGTPIYIATAQAFDAEMEERISRHKSDRGPNWITLEEPLDLPAAIAEAGQGSAAILVDCLTLWLTNILLADHSLPDAFARLESALAAARAPIVLVANEVGLSIVPDNALARRFRDEAGLLNQRVAAVSGEVYFVAAGLPLKLK